MRLEQELQLSQFGLHPLMDKNLKQAHDQEGTSGAAASHSQDLEECKDRPQQIAKKQTKQRKNNKRKKAKADYYKENDMQFLDTIIAKNQEDSKVYQEKSKLQKEQMLQDKRDKYSALSSSEFIIKAFSCQYCQPYLLFANENLFREHMQ